ncbi:MAG TPA: hypothetical protein VNZ52_05975, partial [Candidatus Thermoplasmatota archaeon]|nr:hypothetical protein [Candidatus Thermoplasmatota archaeon]
MGTRVELSRPWTAALLAAASLVDLGIVYLLLRDFPEAPFVPVLGSGLLCMLQAFAGSQALEGRRFILVWLTLAATLLQVVLVPWLLPVDPALAWALGGALVLVLAA